MNETFADKLVDQMPARVWPRAKIPFFCLGVVYLLLSVLGTVMMAMQRSVQSDGQSVTTPRSQTIEVSPGP